MAEAGIPKKMTTTSSSTSTPTASGDSFSGTPCLSGDNCGGTGSSNYKSRMMRGEFRVLLTAWSKSISRRLYDVKCFFTYICPCFVLFFFHLSWISPPVFHSVLNYQKAFWISRLVITCMWLSKIWNTLKNKNLLVYFYEQNW